MAERETELPAPLCLDLLDGTERLPRIRALVVAVLDDHMRTRWPADVVNRLIEWLDSGARRIASTRACREFARGGADRE